MRSIKKVAIIGVGFMGGSLALAIREKFPKISICGYARSNKSYNKLKKLKILNKIEMHLRSCIDNADMVVLALPVEAIRGCLRKIVPFLKKGVIIFDLGSTKELIGKAAHKLLPKTANFVGCHPLTGSEKSGAEFACRNLYKKSICLITSSPSIRATKVVKSFWQKLGANVVFISPDFHDRVLSCTSHLPHLISFSLTKFVSESYLKYSSRSLRDLTRIAGSPSSVWADIFFANKKNILRDTNNFIKSLRTFCIAIRGKDKNKIQNIIKEANIKYKKIAA